jgi:hypothetical protein
MAATPDRPTCTTQEIETWAKEMTFRPMAAMLITFALGQRLGDVLSLQGRSVSTVGEYVALTFFTGKVVPVIGAFVVHVSSTSPIADLLHALRANTEDPLDPLFPDREVTHAEVHSTIGRDVRALRRGGLQRMALEGTDPETILLFSKHRSIEMLNKYLHHGASLIFNAKKTATCVDHLFLSQHSSTTGQGAQPNAPQARPYHCM